MSQTPQSRRKPQRRPMTLLEVVIAMGLAAILLTGLLGIYQLLQSQAAKQRTIGDRLFTQRYLQHRLSEALAQVLKANGEGGKDYAFFTDEGTSTAVQGQSLVFAYYRGIDDRPDFNGAVLARLYRNHDNQLILALWPTTTRWNPTEKGTPPMIQEVLLDNVADLAFGFYSPPATEQQPVSNEDAVTEGKQQVKPPRDQWLASWDKRYEMTPPLMTMRVTHDDSTVDYAFAIPTTEEYITYRSVP